MVSVSEVCSRKTLKGLVYNIATVLYSSWCNGKSREREYRLRVAIGVGYK